MRRRSALPREPSAPRGSPGGALEPLKTAGEIVALLAGLVALLYLLGGAVLALRLMFDNFRLDAVVNLLGQLPREFVITAGFLEAVAPALLVGLLATIVFGIRNGPRLRVHSDRLDTGPYWKRILVALVCVSILLVTPALVLAIDRGQAWEARAAVAAIPVTLGLVLPGWWLIRQIGKKTRWLRFVKAVAAGAVWTGMALVPAVVFAGGVEFERARICVAGEATAISGFLIADTKDRVLLGRNEDDAETVLSFPSRVVEQIQYGDLPGSLDCSPTRPSRLPTRARRPTTGETLRPRVDLGRRHARRPGHLQENRERRIRLAAVLTSGASPVLPRSGGGNHDAGTATAATGHRGGVGQRAAAADGPRLLRPRRPDSRLLLVAPSRSGRTSFVDCPLRASDNRASSADRGATAPRGAAAAEERPAGV